MNTSEYLELKIKKSNLEKRSDVNVETEIGESGGDDLGAAVVTVLAHFRHQNPRVPAVHLHEGGDPLHGDLDL